MVSQLEPKVDTSSPEVAERSARPAVARAGARWFARILGVLITLGMVAVALVAGRAAWDSYMGSPWTRDGTVRAYVVVTAPEVGGKIVELPVADNQFVHKGDLLMVIDPIDYRIAVEQAEAAVEQAEATAHNAKSESARRQQLTDLATTAEEKERFQTTAISAQAVTQKAYADLNLAKANLERTRVVSPVDGYITNLQVQLGDYANIGQKSISVVNTNSFWVDGYFEENALSRIHDGDPATVKLMGNKPLIHGHVESISRGITVPNSQPDPSGLAAVNPIFTWVRLAQRVPVRIHIDSVPEGVRLVVGLTATVQIDPPQSAPPSPQTPSRS
jgi:multidrug resistance efflux pump